MVSTSTKKKPASILNLICGIIILKKVVDGLRPINLDASSIDFPILSKPDCRELLEMDISLMIKANIRPKREVDSSMGKYKSNKLIKTNTPNAITTPGTVSYTHLRAHET